MYRKSGHRASPRWTKDSGRSIVSMTRVMEIPTHHEIQPPYKQLKIVLRKIRNDRYHSNPLEIRCIIGSLETTGTSLIQKNKVGYSIKGAEPKIRPEFESSV